MMCRTSLTPVLRWLIGLALLAAGALALAQQDPPGIVARLSYHQGSVSFSPAGDDSWYDAAPNRPITTGDRLWTDRNARAELHVGSTALRLDDQTSLDFSEIGDQTVRLTVLQGNLQVRVRDALTGQRLEVDTGNLAFVIDGPGEYRFDADQQAGTTRVAVLGGSGTAYGENGESLPLGARQQLAVSGRNLQAAAVPPIQTADAFDRWVAERNRQEDQSISARYVSRGVVGYQQLDQHGDWRNEPEYGAVWYPRSVGADWAPYRDGQWVNVAPWGWTWVDAAPWGFAPSHYGRWARFGPRWGWVPGRTQARPVYSPALVGFIGGSGANVNLSIGGGRNGVGWFPLAPNEEWRPGYRASRRYIEEANRMAFVQNRQIAARNDFFVHQRMPAAVTVVPTDRFGRGPMDRHDVIRLPDDRFARAPAATAPPIPLPALGAVGGAGAFGGMTGRPAAALPPAALQARQQAQLQQFQQAQQTQQQQQQQRESALRIQQQQAQGQAAAQQQQDAMRQAQEAQQRGMQSQPQQALQQQQAMRQAQEARQQQMQQQDAGRQAQEAQQRGAQQQAMRQAQENQQRAIQQQQQQQQQQALQQQNATRQAQEAQLRAAQQQMQQIHQQRHQQPLPGRGPNDQP